MNEFMNETMNQA